MELKLASGQIKKVEAQLRKQELANKDTQDELEEKQALIADLEHKISQKAMETLS